MTSFNIQPESGRLGFGLVFLLECNLENLDGLSDGVSDMLLGAKAESFAAIDGVVEAEEVLFGQELAGFDALDDVKLILFQTT